MSLRTRKKFNSKQEELDAMLAEKEEYDARVRQLRKEAKEEEQRLADDAKVALGQLLINACGVDWTRIDFSKLKETLVSMDVKSCVIAQGRSVYFASRDLKEALSPTKKVPDAS